VSPAAWPVLVHSPIRITQCSGRATQTTEPARWCGVGRAVGGPGRRRMCALGSLAASWRGDLPAQRQAAGSGPAHRQQLAAASTYLGSPSAEHFDDTRWRLRPSDRLVLQRADLLGQARRQPVLGPKAGNTHIQVVVTAMGAIDRDPSSRPALSLAPSLLSSNGGEISSKNVKVAPWNRRAACVFRVAHVCGKEYGSSLQAPQTYQVSGACRPSKSHPHGRTPSGGNNSTQGNQVR